MADLLPWRDDYRLGLPAVAHDHWHLLQALNAAWERHAEGGGYAAADFLNDVHALLAGHFALEEKFMRRAGDPGLEAHAQEHRALLDAVSDLMESQVDQPDTLDADAFATRLADWLSAHFAGADAAMHLGAS